jgi:type VI secretion system secreted protein VgrG
MPLTYTQKNEPLRVTTPLGEDVLLLVGINGSEGISQLFSFQLDLLAEDRSLVKFDELLGKGIAVEVVLPSHKTKLIHGICSRLVQGKQEGDSESFEKFTHYQMEMVPQFWLLTKRKQSRIFQRENVPDILRKVLKGIDVSFQIIGTFAPRDFCVQYRESDFDFASRLMEEEGIFYFFKHTDSGHQMVVANSPQAHPD